MSIPGFMPTCGIDPETFGLQPSTTETQGTLSAIIFPFVTERSTERERPQPLNPWAPCAFAVESHTTSEAQPSRPGTGKPTRNDVSKKIRNSE